MFEKYTLDELIAMRAKLIIDYTVVSNPASIHYNFTAKEKIKEKMLAVGAEMSKRILGE